MHSKMQICKKNIRAAKIYWLVLPDPSAASPLPLPSSWQETRVHESKKANKNIRNCQPMLLCKKEWAWLLKVMEEMGTRVIFSLLPITILGAIHKWGHHIFGVEGSNIHSHKQEPFLSALQNMGNELFLGIFIKI